MEMHDDPDPRIFGFVDRILLGFHQGVRKNRGESVASS
jgi:hypothetical protein